MYVRNHMLPKENLTTVDLDESVESALKKILNGNFLSLPVVDKGELKGLLMKEAIYRRYFDKNLTDKEDYLKNTKVRDLYVDKYETIYDSERIEKASFLLKKLSVPFLAVFDNNDKFLGILTHFAIFNAFSEVFGLDKGSRIVINMIDMPGQLARLLEVLRRDQVNIMNFAMVDAKIMGIVRIILRVDTENLDDLIEKIQDEGFRIDAFDREV